MHVHVFIRINRYNTSSYFLLIKKKKDITLHHSAFMIQLGWGSDKDDGGRGVHKNFPVLLLIRIEACIYRTHDPLNQIKTKANN